MLVAAPPWHSATSMPERRSYFAAAQVGADVYVAGGMVGGTGAYVLRLDRFDPRADRWTREPDLPGRGPRRGGCRASAAGSTSSAGRRARACRAARMRSTRRRAAGRRARRCRRRATTRLPPRSAARSTSRAASATSTRCEPCSPTTRARTAGARSRRCRGRCTTLALVAVPRRALGDRRLRRAQATPCGPCGSTRRRTQRWRAGPRLVAPRRDARRGRGAAGACTPSPSESFESYAPGSGWTRGPSLSVPRHALGLFAEAGRLWAIGGCVVPELADSRVVESRPLG